MVNANNKRAAPQEDPWNNWRGERRSTRLGAPVDVQPDAEPPHKRARTAESSISTGSVEPFDTAAPETSHGQDSKALRLKTTSAAALKPTEVALEQIAGKRRSKYWVYAVEPAPGLTAAPPDPDPAPLNGSHGSIATGMNGISGAHTPRRDENSENRSNSMDYDRSMEGSLSPLDSPNPHPHSLQSPSAA